MKQKLFIIILFCLSSRICLIAQNNNAVVRLKNHNIELEFIKKNNSFQLAKLINNLSGKTTAILNDDFKIQLKNKNDLTSTNFEFVDLVKEKTDAKQVLKIKFKHRENKMSLIISYSLGDNDYFARRKIELFADDPIEILEVAVWNLGFEDHCLFQEVEEPKYPHPVWGFAKNKGFGQPVFFEDSFWGLEYPAGYNHYENDILALTHFPAKSFKNKYTSKTIVFGVTEKGKVEKRFLQYLNTILALPFNQKELFINYNTWMTLMPPTEENSLELISLFNEKLFTPYDAYFDTYTIDDGWDDKKSLWNIRSDRFPNRFDSIRTELKSIKSELGLWLSPSSGYDHGPWLVANGYAQNGTRGKYICQSDPKYVSDLNKIIEELVVSNDLKFFKFDGNCVNCDAVDHPWHLTGDFAKETNVDALLDLLSNIKEKQPNIYIDITTGVWLSPWWLQYSSSIWGELYDGDPKAIIPTPIPGYGKFTTRDMMIHKRVSENPAFPFNAIEHLGIYTPDYNTMHDEIMSIIGRGSRLLTFYFNPYELLRTDEDWEFLGRALNWARLNSKVLGNTKLIKSDIENYEPYGYLHFSNNKGIISISNPFIEPKSISVSLQDLMDAEPAKVNKVRPEFYAEIVYPYRQILDSNLSYNDSINVELQGYESLLIEVKAMDKNEIAVVGGRYQALKNNDNTTSFEVFGRAGTKQEFRVVGNNISKDENLQIEFPGKIENASAEGGDIKFSNKNGLYTIEGKCQVFVPENSSASMHFLYVPIAPSALKPRCIVKVNGVAIKTEINNAQLDLPHIRVFDEIPISDWSFINFEIPAGNSLIEIELSVPENNSDILKVKTGWWLWLEHSLRKLNINIENDNSKVDKKYSTPLPMRIDKRREIITVNDLKTFSSEKEIFNTSKKMVGIQDLTPTIVAMSKGQMQINKNFNQTDLVVSGEVFKKGIGMHSYGRVKYEIEGLGFTKFQSLIGLDDSAGNGDVEFEVWVDGIKKYASGLMKKNTSKNIKIDITNSKSIELRVQGGTDGTEKDYANWCDPTLSR